MEQHYKIIDTLLDPVKEQSQSIRDTLYAMCQILEPVQMIRLRKVVSNETMQEATLSALFKLGFYPFWQVHGATLRPIMLQSFEKDGDVIENFLKEALPASMTILMPNDQSSYYKIKEQVAQLYKG